MRNAVNNPFSPGSDSVPQIWAGRTLQLNDWRDVVRPRRIAGLPERGRTILGEAGLGKSTLVRRIAADAAKSGDWVTPQLRIPSGTDPLKAVATAVLELADQAGLATRREVRIEQLLDRVRAVAVSGTSVTLDRREGPEPHTALTGLLVEVGKAAIDREAVVLIHVDEVQNITDDEVLSQLLIALGDVIAYEVPVRAVGGVEVQRTLPVAVYLTGLPDFDDMHAKRTGATFARRFATTTLSAIADDDMAFALRPFVVDGWEVPDESGGLGTVRMDEDAAAAIINLCRGEPFLFQLAGERAWYASSSAVITSQDVLTGWTGAKPEAITHVERILGRLPGREREFLEAMADLNSSNRSLTTIAQLMGLKDGSQAGPTSQRLDSVRGIINRGKPYTFRHRAIEAYLTSSWPNV